MTEQEKPSDAPSLADEGPISTADLAGKDGPVIGRGDAGASQDQSSSEEPTEPLFPAEDAAELRGRWDSIQAGFVDEPRKAVESADSLVAVAMKRLAETFANERAGLEAQWDRGEDVSTEDLRVALRRYRSFFGRLLSM
jgi:hypothetical protein